LAPRRADTNDKPRSNPAIDITVCGRHRGWRLSNNRAYRLLFPAEALIAA